MKWWSREIYGWNRSVGPYAVTPCARYHRSSGVKKLLESVREGDRRAAGCAVALDLASARNGAGVGEGPHTDRNGRRGWRRGGGVGSRVRQRQSRVGGARHRALKSPASERQYHHQQSSVLGPCLT